MAIELKIGDWVMDSSWTPPRLAQVQLFGRAHFADEGREKGRVLVFLTNGRTDDCCSAWGPVELENLCKVIKVED